MRSIAKSSISKVILLMDKFPETFTASNVSQKYNERKKAEQLIYIGEYEIGKIYTWYNQLYDINEINQIIDKIRSCGQHVLINQVAKYSKNGRHNCGQHVKLEYTFCTKEYFNNLVEKEKREIREKIYNIVKPSHQQFCIEFTKIITKSMDDIIKELKELEWDIKTVDHWKHINDDYCIIDLFMKC